MSRDGSDSGRQKNDFGRTRNDQWLVNLPAESISFSREFVVIYFYIILIFVLEGLAFFFLFVRFEVLAPVTVENDCSRT